MGLLRADDVCEHEYENYGAEYSSLGKPSVVTAWQSSAVQAKDVKLRDSEAYFLWWNILRTS